MISKKQISVYRSCSTLPIYNFCMASVMNDYRYMLRDYNDEDNDVYQEYKENEGLIKLYDEITLEWRTVTKDKKEFNKLKDEGDLRYLESIYDLSSTVLSIYNETERIEVLGCLENLGFEFDKTKLIGPQIDIILKKLIGIKNKIKIRTVNFKNKYKVGFENDDEQEIEVIEIIKNLEDKALYFTMELELGYPVDIRKTSLIQWANLDNRCKEKRLAHEKSKMR